MLLVLRGDEQGREVKSTGLYCRHWLSHQEPHVSAS